MARLTARQVTIDLGLRVAELRRSQGLTQQALADRIGWDIRQFQRVESGRGDVAIDLAKLVALANGLGVEIRQLLEAPTERLPRRPGRPRKR